MSPPEISRRAALSGVVAALAVAGCELESPGTSPTTAPTTDAPGGQPSAEAEPDAALVEAVRAEIAGALALVTAAASRPALAGELAEWRRLHRLHLEAIPGEAASVPEGAVAGNAARVRTRIRERERRLQGTLADAAVEAESGPLAALLASMSAAVAQQLVATGGGR